MRRLQTKDKNKLAFNDGYDSDKVKVKYPQAKAAWMGHLAGHRQARVLASRSLLSKLLSGDSWFTLHAAGTPRGSWRERTILKPDSSSRICAAALMGVALGSLLHYDYLKWHERFDRHFTGEHGLAGSLIVGIVLMAFALGAYELLVLLCGWMFGATDGRKSNNS